MSKNQIQVFQLTKMKKVAVAVKIKNQIIAVG